MFPSDSHSMRQLHHADMQSLISAAPPARSSPGGAALAPALLAKLTLRRTRSPQVPTHRIRPRCSGATSSRQSRSTSSMRRQGQRLSTTERPAPTRHPPGPPQLVSQSSRAGRRQLGGLGRGQVWSGRRASSRRTHFLPSRTGIPVVRRTTATINELIASDTDGFSKSSMSLRLRLCERTRVVDRCVQLEPIVDRREVEHAPGCPISSSPNAHSTLGNSQV